MAHPVLVGRRVAHVRAVAWLLKVEVCVVGPELRGDVPCVHDGDAQGLHHR